MSLPVSEKELIEREFGPLWSGVDSVTLGDRIFTAKELKRALDLWADDIVGIDLVVLPGDTFAFRFYDGDDRCVVAFVMDHELNILREYRAHIAGWLEEEYYASGIEAFFAEKLVGLLRGKVAGRGTPSSGEGDPG